jgi:hypothetical protein
MRSFLKFIGEEKTAENSGHIVMSFIRGNPPHEGHGEVIRAGQEEAKRVGGRHVVIVSHSQDPKKNPLSAKQKIKHFQRAFPGVRFEASTPANPTLLHHLSRMYNAGHREVTIVGGSDRDTMGQMAQQYNGVKGKGHGYYKMKMHFKQAGETRSDTGKGVASYSASKMRDAVKRGDKDAFKKMAPKGMKDEHVEEMYNETSKGMGVK